MKLSHREIDRQAADWIAKREFGTGDQAAFEAWLAADSRNLGAYARAEAVFAEVERVGATGALSSPAEAPQPALSRRRMMLSGSVAAGLGLAALGGAFAWHVLSEETYATRLGEIQVVALADGSVVTLNTNSRISVRYSKTRRDIHLLQGEALFDVARNKLRPFVVAAGDTQVRAVGTSFVVQMLPERPVRVLVREGVVEVKRPNIPEAAPVRVTANAQASAPAGQPIVAHAANPAQIAREMSWRIGRIAFDNVTLKAAADEFARYSNTKIVVDSEIADQTVTGVFAANDPVGFARAAALSLNLRSDVAQSEVRISR